MFVPHAGCPHRCNFCDQRVISATEQVPDAACVQKTLDTAIEHLGDRARTAELAFFGGSFTAIDRSLMCQLLEAAQPYIGKIAGIRISTRPDAVDQTVLGVLKKYGVTAIELGAQSMDDRVLAQNRRGHSARDTTEASARIRANGFSLGLQMMTGLPGSSMEQDLATAQALISLKPDTVRIYPTVVLAGTALEQAYQSEVYVPPSLDETVTLCAMLSERFEQADIKVIKLGLHAGEVESHIVAGPWHPALRELVESKRMLSKITAAMPHPCDMVVRVAPCDLSKAVGHCGQNRKQLEKMGYQVAFEGTLEVPPGAVEMERRGKEVCC